MKMEVCAGDRVHPHDEIVYLSNSCPLCYALDENRRLERELNEKEEEKKDANN